MNTDHLWLYHFLLSLMDYTIHSIGYVHKRNVVIMIHTFTWLILKWFETWYVTNTKYPRTHNSFQNGDRTSSQHISNTNCSMKVIWESLWHENFNPKIYIHKSFKWPAWVFFPFFFLLKRQNSFFFIIVDSYIMRFLRVYTN